LPETARLHAEEIEKLMPKVMRSLFHHSPEDPLADFPVGQLRVLRLISEGVQTPGEIGHAFGMSPSAVSQTLNRLHVAGLIERTGDSHDRRVRNLQLTESGQRLIQARQTQRIETATHVLREMELADRAQLIGLLEKLLVTGERMRPPLDRPDEEFEALALGTSATVPREANR
jgi:DNA-binding MarR family transcriptional regulator